MDCGKLTESIYERSVIKVIKTNSIENRKFYNSAVPGADCAVLACMISGQALASGLDAQVAARAYMAAVNYAAACGANISASDLSDIYANITLVVPERLREIKVRHMVEEAALKAEEMGIPILSCNVQVMPSVTEALAVCVVNAGEESSFTVRHAKAGEDIVMTKWIALEGTSLIARLGFDKLCSRYPADIVEKASDFYQYLSIVKEASAAVKSGAGYMQVVREGGIFGGLWQLAADNGVGLVVDLKSIPVRQETIEVCEFFDLNPYELLSGGSLLITASNGGELVRQLKESGIEAAVIGQTTQGNDRIIRHGDESRFLEPARGDEIFRYMKLCDK